MGNAFVGKGVVMKPLLITINPSDTVAILTETGRKGEMIGDIILLSDIPQGHKVALKDLTRVMLFCAMVWCSGICLRM